MTNLREIDEFRSFKVENYPGHPVLPNQRYELTLADQAAIKLLSGSAERLELNRIKKISLGTLIIVSGRLTVFDPLWDLDQWSNPIDDHHVKCGRFEAELLAIKAGDWGERNAALILRLSSSPTALWRPAQFAASPQYAPDERSHLISTDCGAIGLADMESISMLRQHIEKRISQGEITEESDHLDEMNNGFDGVAQNFLLENGGGNILIVGTGIGDGSYPLYWGLDAEGRPTELVVSFYLIEATFRKYFGD